VLKGFIDYEGSAIIGIFSTMEAAKKRESKLLKTRDFDAYGVHVYDVLTEEES
jgi:hypothetical protein